MTARDLARWARTTELPTPLDWAALEARARAETPSPQEQDEAQMLAATGSMTGLSRSRTIVSRALLVMVGAPIIGLPLIGGLLAYLHAHRNWTITADPELQGVLDQAWAFIALAGLAVTTTPALIMRSTSRRSRTLAWWTVLNLVASATTSATLLLAPHPLLTPWPLIQWLAMLAAVISIGTLLLLARYPAPLRVTSAERNAPITTPRDALDRFYRSVLLHELVKRGRLNDVDRGAISSLPLGAWATLDSLPDGRVIRR